MCSSVPRPMGSDTKPTILCLASYEKGHEFLRECAEQGWRVVLLTSESLRDNATFPTECLDETFYMPDVTKEWNREHTIEAVSHLARSRQFDRIVPLDDFDLEIAASLREHLRVPGMGETTTRHFRDKLAMRVTAASEGLQVPEFVHLLNDERIAEFTRRVPAPWVLKPRFSAGATGIKKLHTREALYEHAEALGDRRSFYLVERHVPGRVLHVDSLVDDGRVRFRCVCRYGRPPLDVSHGGDVFTTQVVERGSTEETDLVEANAKVLAALGLVRGASHTEFIRGDDGKLYFLETSARVGGAHVADLVEAATGVRLWREWARIELAGGNGSYAPPPQTHLEYAGLLLSLARQESPDTSGYTDSEIVWRLSKRHHVGFILRSSSYGRLDTLLEQYVERVRDDFHAHAEPLDRPSD